MDANFNIINKIFAEYVAAARIADYDKAKKFLKISIALDPSSANYYNHIAGVYSEEGEFGIAISILNRSRKLNPGDRSFLISLANFYESLGEIAIAKSMVEEEISRGNDSFSSQILLISILIKSENYSEAAEFAKKLLSYKFIEDNKFIYAANKLISLTDFSSALLAFEELISKTSDERVKKISESYRNLLSNGIKTQEIVKICDAEELEKKKLCRHLPLSSHRKILHIHDAYVGISSQSIMVKDQLCIDLCYHIDENAKPDVIVSPNPKFGLRNTFHEIELDEAIFIGGGRNYYHWMVDYLPNLGIIEKCGILKDVPVIFGGELASYQQQSLMHIGFDFSRHLNTGQERVVHCSQLWAVIRSSKRRNIMGMPDWWQSKVETETLHWLRDAFLNSSSGVGGQRNRKLYLARGNASLRRLVNGNEVIEIMMDAGYEIIYPEHLSVIEQVNLFSEASHVIGVHGAAFTNIIFMSPGSKVLEIVGRYKPPEFYKKIAGFMHLAHDVVEAKIVRINKKSTFQDPRFGDLFIEASQLREKLAEFDDCFRR